MVIITSCTPILAFNIPGTAAHRAPPAAAARMHRGISIKAGKLVKVNPTQVARKLPIYTCPSPPMLNKPQRKAKATANPVNIKGVALNSTFPQPSLFPIA
ncbi:hypothetical protein ES708_21965 [subsurface metagenome]